MLELLSSEDVDEAVVQSTDGKITFREAQEGVDFAGDRAETVRRVEPGRPVMWEVETPQPPRGGTARMKLGCMVDGESWGYFFDVKLPSAPRQSVVMG